MATCCPGSAGNEEIVSKKLEKLNAEGENS